MLKQQPYKSITPQFKGRLRRAYERLSPDERQEVTDRYKRHLRACEKAGCDPEIMYLLEAVEEVAAGRGL